MISGCSPILLISGKYNAFNTGYNACGIYGISGLQQTESFETPIYVGSTENLKKRLDVEHFGDLRRSEHPNAPLQNYFNKYGLENLVFLRLEICFKEDLLKTEQKYIDYYGVAEDRKAFNIARDAKSPMLGRKFPYAKREKHSKDTIEKMSISRKKYWENPENKNKLIERLKRNGNPMSGKKVSEETRQKMREAAKNRPNRNVDYKKIAEKNSKEFSLVDPHGNIYHGKNMTKFSQENNLDLSNIAKLVKGKKNIYKGWKRYEEE
jgi:group I intron endonuclease